MNFDYIEGLTEEQVNILFDGIVETNTETALEVWDIRCSNGKSGFYWSNGDGVFQRGFRDYTIQYSYNWAIADVCGIGQWGYNELVVDDENTTKQVQVWKIKCSNGREGFYFVYSYNNFFPVGFTDYTIQYSYNWAIADVCGIGQWGYNQLIVNGR